MTEPSGRTRPRVPLLSTYPLDHGLWGATTRIAQLRAALAGRVSAVLAPVLSREVRVQRIGELVGAVA
jgi:hypothetical protein